MSIVTTRELSRSIQQRKTHRRAARQAAAYRICTFAARLNPPIGTTVNCIEEWKAKTKQALRAAMNLADYTPMGAGNVTWVVTAPDAFDQVEMLREIVADLVGVGPTRDCVRSKVQMRRGRAVVNGVFELVVMEVPA